MNDDQHKKRQISLGYVAVALLLIFGLQFLFVRGMNREIPYSEFKQYLDQGMLRDLSVSPTDIRGVIVRGETEDAVEEKEMTILFTGMTVYMLHEGLKHMFELSEEQMATIIDDFFTKHYPKLMRREQSGG